MELFKTKETKKEFNELIYDVIPSLNDCDNCRILKCYYCSKFLIDCNMCRQERCKNCFAFDSSKEILMDKCDEYTQKYIANFLTDFLKISDVTANFFNLSITKEIVKEKNNYFLSKKEKKKCADFLKNYKDEKLICMVKGRK